MPAKFVRPCIPTTAKAIPRGEDWMHEPKLDGYRLQIVKDGPALRLYSRSGYDWTRRLASLAEALAGLLCSAAAIDGELVFPAADGSPDFYGLRSAMIPGRQHELAVFAFDLVHHNGEDLRPIPSLTAACSSPSSWRVPVCRACTWCGGSTTARSSWRRPSGMVWRASFQSARRRSTLRDRRAIG